MSLGYMGGVMVDQTEAPMKIFVDDCVLRLFMVVSYVFGLEIKLALIKTLIILAWFTCNNESDVDELKY